MSTSDTTGTSLPPGIWYFSRITETDHAGYVWITTLMMLIVPLATCWIRLYVRWGAFQGDDWTLAAATLLSVVLHAIVMVGLKKGLGQLSSVLDKDDTLFIDRILLATEVLFVLVHTAAKVALALFVRRLFNSGRRLNAILCWGLLASTVTWGVVSLFVLLIDCSDMQFLSPEACPGLYQRWQAVTALDVVSELALVVVPSYLVSSVLINMAPKLRVACAFLSRIGSITFSILHLTRVKLSLDAAGSGFSYVGPLIWLEVLVGVSLMTASIPTFNTFMRPFEHISIPYDNTAPSASRSRDTTEYGSYLMMGPQERTTANHSKSRSSGKSKQLGMASEGQMRFDRVSTQTSIQHRARANSMDHESTQSCNSQEGIIRRDRWEIKVE